MATTSSPASRPALTRPRRSPAGVADELASWPMITHVTATIRPAALRAGHMDRVRRRALAMPVGLAEVRLSPSTHPALQTCLKNSNTTAAGQPARRSLNGARASAHKPLSRVFASAHNRPRTAGAGLLSERLDEDAGDHHNPPPRTPHRGSVRSSEGRSAATPAPMRSTAIGTGTVDSVAHRAATARSSGDAGRYHSPAARTAGSTAQFTVVASLIRRARPGASTRPRRCRP